MTISVLISCMHQKDMSIAERSNAKTNAIVVNQCDRNNIEDTTFTANDGNKHDLRFINTTERGLSRSRNMAVDNSEDDICLIMDDDELLADNYADIITEAYQKYKKADVIVFNVGNSNKKYDKKPHKVGYLSALKVASWEISFKRKSIRDNGIRFDVEMGSGTGHGSGEEIAFLYECLHKGLTIWYVPSTIASLDANSESQWFKGFSKRYFLERGWATKRYMGKIMATLYAFYFAVRKINLYKQDCTPTTALLYMLKGIYIKDVLTKDCQR